MKKLFLLLVVALFAYGCAKRNGCTDTNASNYDSEAKEDNGGCVFPREKLIGFYDVTKTCNPGNFLPCMELVAQASNTAGIIMYFKGSDCSFDNDTINATISGSEITIPLQTRRPNGKNATISGHGTYSGTQITMQTTDVVAGYTMNCNISAVKN